jgi:hypothetical protein
MLEWLFSAILRRQISYEIRRKSCILSLKAASVAARNTVCGPITARFGVVGSRRVETHDPRLHKVLTS